MYHALLEEYRARYPSTTDYVARLDAAAREP
jgi:hypothetical protein